MVRYSLIYKLLFSLVLNKSYKNSNKNVQYTGSLIVHLLLGVVYAYMRTCTRYVVQN